MNRRRFLCGALAGGAAVGASLARPGGNTTGLTDVSTGEFLQKRIELLREIVPLRRLAILEQPRGTSGEQRQKWRSGVTAALHGMDIRVDFVEAANVEALPEAFGALARDRPDAMYAIESPLFVQNARRVAELALDQRLPLLGGAAAQARAGALLAYGASFEVPMRLVAVYIDKILHGARPADLPVQQPTRFELVINLGTAKALGFTIPPSALARADEVIE